MGWNIKEAARECGLPAATWRLWEIDGALPRNIVTVSMTIATRTRCDYLWLLTGSDRPRTPTTLYAGARRIPRRRGAKRLHPAAWHQVTRQPVMQPPPIEQNTPVETAISRWALQLANRDGGL
jgi:hypothetical protein